MTFTLSRRRLLRGLGAVVALPTLELMLDGHGEAWADGTARPRRFMTWFFGNGIIKSRWTPSATGTGWALSEQLAPLVDTARGFNLRQDVSVMSGFDVKTPNLRGHHNGAAALLSAAPFIPLAASGADYASKFGASSIDQLVADSLGGSTTFKSLQLAVSKRATTGEGPTLAYISHRGPDAPLPPQTNPLALFTRLFSSFTPSDPTDPTDRLRASVLDAVKADAAGLRTRLGAADRQRLDAHLTSINELQARIRALPPVLTSSCQKPPAPTQTNQDVNHLEPIEAVSSVMSDLVALAFACDLTRVVSFQFSGAVGDQCFKSLSPNEPRDNEHSLTHDGAQQNKVHDAVVFTMRNFAYTLSALKRTADGAGTLLDNTCVLCTTDVAEGLAHSIDDYPILLAGRAGGSLKSGLHVRSNNGRNTSDVLFTCLKALGTGHTSVGRAEGLSQSAVTELLT